MAVSRTFIEDTITVSQEGNDTGLGAKGLKAIVNYLIANVPGWTIASVITDTTYTYSVYLSYYGRCWLWLKNDGGYIRFTYGLIAVGNSVPTTEPSSGYQNRIDYMFYAASSGNSTTGTTTYTLKFRFVIGLLGNFLGSFSVNSFQSEYRSAYLCVGFGWCTSKQYGFNAYFLKLDTSVEDSSSRNSLYYMVPPVWRFSTTPTAASGVTCSASTSAYFPDGTTSTGTVTFMSLDTVPVLNTAVDPNHAGMFVPIAFSGHNNNGNGIDQKFWGNFIWGGLYDLYVLIDSNVINTAKPFEYVIVDGTAYRSLFGGLLIALPSVYV